MSSSAIIELASGSVVVWREGSSIYTDRQVTQEELDEIHRLMRTADELVSSPKAPTDNS